MSQRKTEKLERASNPEVFRSSLTSWVIFYSTDMTCDTFHSVVHSLSIWQGNDTTAHVA